MHKFYGVYRIYVLYMYQIDREEPLITIYY